MKSAPRNVICFAKIKIPNSNSNSCVIGALLQAVVVVSCSQGRVMLLPMYYSEYHIQCVSLVGVYYPTHNYYGYDLFRLEYCKNSDFLKCAICQNVIGEGNSFIAKCNKCQRDQIMTKYGLGMIKNNPQRFSQDDLLLFWSLG